MPVGSTIEPEWCKIDSYVQRCYLNDFYAQLTVHSEEDHLFKISIFCQRDCDKDILANGVSVSARYVVDTTIISAESEVKAKGYAEALLIKSEAKYYEGKFKW